MLLGVLTQDSDDNKKKEQLNSHRAQYKQLADKYLSAASTKQKPVFNPLVKITSGVNTLQIFPALCLWISSGGAEASFCIATESTIRTAPVPLQLTL